MLRKILDVRPGPDGRLTTFARYVEEATMEKLDAKFTGTIIKVKDGTTVPDDEYVVFLAKDNAFAKALPYYLMQCVKMLADDEQVLAVVRMIRRVDAWRAAHPDRCKTPDAKGEKLLDTPGALRLGHPFIGRVKFNNGVPTGELDARECGFVIDPMLNAPAFDPVHCNRPPEEH